MSVGRPKGFAFTNRYDRLRSAMDIAGYILPYNHRKMRDDTEIKSFARHVEVRL